MINIPYKESGYEVEFNELSIKDKLIWTFRIWFRKKFKMLVKVHYITEEEE